MNFSFRKAAELTDGLVQEVNLVQEFWGDLFFFFLGGVWGCVVILRLGYPKLSEHDPLELLIVHPSPKIVDVDFQGFI